MSKHAVFARTPAGRWYRITDWRDEKRAQCAYARLKDPFQPGGEPAEIGFFEDSNHRSVTSREPVQHLAVRSQEHLGKEGTGVLVRGETAVTHPGAYVTLSASYRRRLADTGRRAGNLDAAADAITTALLDSGDWDHLDAATISDYGWGLARFCFPAEARYA